MPRQLGPYAVERELGTGGMGTVLLARHERASAPVALKLAVSGGEAGWQALREESALLSRLARAEHPGIVRWLEGSPSGAFPWYAMELIEGPSLHAFCEQLWREPGLTRQVANGRLSEVLRLLGHLAAALGCAHSLGVVHCDVTPRNVLLRAGNCPVLIDFGTSVQTFAAGSARELWPVEGRAHGTVGYMPPEQLARGLIDARADLYALGCIAYELLTGRAPFLADQPDAIAAQHRLDAPLPPSARVGGVPPEVDALVLALLEKDPRRRCSFAADVVQALERWVQPPVDAPSFAPQLFRPRLTGRQALLDALLGAAERTARGQGRWLLLSGASGSGKTRLTREWTRQLRDSSLLVLSGSCSEPPAEAARAAPRAALQPFLGFLRWLADRCSAGDDELRAQLATELAVLAAYEPALAELPGLPLADLPELPAALARRRVLRSLRDCLFSVAERRPVLLVLDDLHAADELALEFLASEHVRALGQSRVLIVGTRRPEQVNARLEAAIAAGAPELLELSPLDPREVRALMADMLGEELMPGEFVAFVHRKSEGNPLYVAEYLRIAAESGLLRRAAGRWHFPAPGASLLEPYGALAAPSSLHEVARVRLAAASADERALLALAAVLGREFDPELVQPVPGPLDCPAQHIPLLLEALVARDFLERSTAGWYRFRHDTLRSAAESEALPEQRARLHRAAAERKGAALREGRGAATGYAVQIGSHWALGQEPARALSALGPAARQAEQAHAHELALELYALAVEQCWLLHGAEAIWPEPALSLAEELGDLLARTAQHVQARKQYALAIERGNEPLSLARLWRKFAETHWKVHEYRAALAALEQGADQLGKSPPDGPDAAREHIALQQARFSVHYFENPHAAATARLIGELLPLVEAHGTPQQKSYFFQCVANERVGRERYRYSEEAVDYERRALHALESESAGVVDRALAQFDLGFMLLLGGRAQCEEAAPLLRAAADVAERFEDLTLLSRATTYLSSAERRLRRFEAARSAAERALEIAERAQITPYVGVALANSSWSAWHAGDGERARAFAQRARGHWTHPEHVFPFQWLANLVLLDIEVADAAHAAAERLLAELLEPRQQLLPVPLDAALRAAAAACRSGPGMAAHRALEQALLTARDQLYL